MPGNPSLETNGGAYRDVMWSRQKGSRPGPQEMEVPVFPRSVLAHVGWVKPSQLFTHIFRYGFFSLWTLKASRRDLCTKSVRKRRQIGAV